jgi:dihydroxyacetone kinase-like protein
MVDNKKVIEILQAIVKKMVEEKDFLTELDNKIGDGDHGINLARGFAAVDEQLPGIADKDIGTILKNTGMKLVSTVGGASGPLYGTAFMKAGAAVAGKMEVGGEDFIAMMEAAIEGIKMRGKAVEGEKTMLDALLPAVNAFKEEYGKTAEFKTAFAKALAAAEKGVEYTKTIIATKGRASYLGERSIGHQDPGATSTLFLLQTIGEKL